MRLVFKKEPDIDHDDYASDIRRIIEVCKKYGYDISYQDAKLAWEKHSDAYCAGWLFLPEKDNDVLSCVLSHCEELEEKKNSND